LERFVLFSEVEHKLWICQLMLI